MSERFQDLANHLARLELLRQPGNPATYARPVQLLRYVAPPPLGPGPEGAAVGAWAPGTTQQAMDAVSAVIAVWNWAPHRRLSLLEIRDALAALPGADKLRVWNWLTSGTPAVWARHTGVNDAAMAAIHSGATGFFAIRQAVPSLQAALDPHIDEARLRLAMMMLEDWPEALTLNPALQPPVPVAGSVPLS